MAGAGAVSLHSQVLLHKSPPSSKLDWMTGAFKVLMDPVLSDCPWVDRARLRSCHAAHARSWASPLRVFRGAFSRGSFDTVVGELLVWVVGFFVVIVVGSSLLLFMEIQNIAFCLWFILEVLRSYVVISVSLFVLGFFAFYISSL